MKKLKLFALVFWLVLSATMFGYALGFGVSGKNQAVGIVMGLLFLLLALTASYFIRKAGG